MADHQLTTNPTVLYSRLKAEVRDRVSSVPTLMRTNLRTKEEFRVELSRQLASCCRQFGVELVPEDHDQIVKDLLEEIFGFGPLEQLMKDPKITDVLVNGAKNVYVERDGILHATDVDFPDDDYLLGYIRRLVTAVGRKIDESTPMVDARLPDGSRLNAIIPPLALRGPTLSIRRFSEGPMYLEDMVDLKSLSNTMAQFLAKAVEARTGILISGATGSGKTTLLNALSRFIPHSERVITIEQTAELQLQQPDVVSLEARPPNIEGKGEIHVRDLLKNSLRMRPDRIIVGECRGAEVFDVLQAMLTGHDGSMSTIHAGDARDALRRMELMMALAGLELPKQVLQEYVGTAVKLVVHLRRFPGGQRKVVQISEVTGYADSQIQCEDIFSYRQTTLGEMGETVGYFQATGYVPQVLEHFALAGVEFSQENFRAGEQAIGQDHQQD